MKILFIHQNFPGQYKHLAPALADKGHEVSAFSLRNAAPGKWEGVNVHPYELTRHNSKDSHPLVIDFESKVIRAEACLSHAVKFRNAGYYPDIVVAHPGWGESLFLKEVWPNAKFKLYCEFFYHAREADVGFDAEYASTDLLAAAGVELKNANLLLQFQQSDAGISPTEWQASTFPRHIRKKISVIHDGIDTEALKPNPTVRFVLDNGEVITRDDEVVTFVSRSLEPYRGFHVFMRSLPKLLSEKPDAKILIVGNEGVSYGAKPSNGTTWKQQFCNEVFPALTSEQIRQIHFLGVIPYDRFMALLQVSRVHVYLTYPFVLSWSLLEAMSAGCAIVASDTQPLHEAIKHNENGLLADFFNPQGLASSVISLLDDSEKRETFGQRARAFAIEHYDLQTVCLPQQLKWVEG